MSLDKLLATAALALATTTALAEYPDKPITIVVPFAAGGPTDKVARDLAEAMRKPLGGATIVIENVVGAGGTLGAAKVAHAAPDGYTLLLHHIGIITDARLDGAEHKKFVEAEIAKWTPIIKAAGVYAD